MRLSPTAWRLVQKVAKNLDVRPEVVVEACVLAIVHMVGKYPGVMEWVVTAYGGVFDAPAAEAHRPVKAPKIPRREPRQESRSHGGLKHSLGDKLQGHLKTERTDR